MLTLHLEVVGKYIGVNGAEIARQVTETCGDLASSGSGVEKFPVEAIR